MDRTAAPTWDSANKALLFEGLIGGSTDCICILSMVNYPTQLAKNIILGDLSYIHSVQMERNFSS